LAVNGYTDHIHIFFELNPDKSISELVRIIKANSSKWINENKFVAGKFEWQRGYGAFSYAYSQRNNAIQYILNQENHHSSKNFKQEYIEMLQNFAITHNPNYLFDFYDKD
jgi:REP element-mobilizing transposase RayT